ncbi:MAG: hypothetical protein AAF293_13245 [Pseudomonadota bacterium]
MKLGVICGMEAEAKALGALRLDPRLIVGISAARPDRAEDLAREMIDADATALLSWGIAGGLAPGLASGTLVVATSVTDATQQTLALTRPTNLGDASDGHLFGSDHVIQTPEEKAILWQTTGAVAVDMETHRIARAAHQAALPCLAIRAISDVSTRALPPGTEDALDDKGKPRILPVLFGLMRDPSRLGALLAAKRDLDTALTTLSSQGVTVLKQILHHDLRTGQAGPEEP